MNRTASTRVGIAGLIGSTVEWYDFYIYGLAAALVFGHQFFPAFSPTAGTLAAFATFAVGFAARPLGGIVFGHVGDRYGRRNTLMLTLFLMGAATVVIGLLPGYDSIGIWAPILLVTLRFLQGFAVGGEWAAPSRWWSRAPRRTGAACSAASRRWASRSGSCCPPRRSRWSRCCPTTR